VELVEASRYADVDGVVVTGALHSFSVPKVASFSVVFHPVEEDPKYHDAGLPPGYWTTRPGIRESAFFYSDGAEQAVLTYDEQTKDTITGGELATFGAGLEISIARGIHVPVLTVVGDYDSIVCWPGSCSQEPSTAHQERDVYSPDACPELVIVPQNGHMLGLHLTAPTSFAAIIDWSMRRMGTTTTRAAPGCAIAPSVRHAVRRWSGRTASRAIFVQ
jgi:pimeloyl-ACP methyl ester carboxylesterase